MLLHCTLAAYKTAAKTTRLTDVSLFLTYFSVQSRQDTQSNLYFSLQNPSVILYISKQKRAALIECTFVSL